MMNINSVEVLSSQPSKRLNHLRVNEGVNLYIENVDEPYPYEELQEL